MDIASERGPVVASYPLETIAGGTDQSTGLLLPNKQGCANGMAPANVGNFHYSTSRTSGSLTFTVNAYDSNGKVVETKISDPMAIPCPAGLVESGECKVELPMARVPTPKSTERFESLVKARPCVVPDRALSAERAHRCPCPSTAQRRARRREPCVRALSEWWEIGSVHRAVILISAAGEVDNVGGGTHGIRALDTTTGLHEAGGVSSAQAAADAEALRLSS